MNEELEKRTVAFIRAMSEPCRTCFRRDRCGECPSGWASHLMRDIEADSCWSEPDYSIAARMDRIMKVLSAADGPLQSEDIRLDDICSRQLKYWTLSALVKWGRINRKRIGNRYHYFLNENENGRPK